MTTDTSSKQQSWQVNILTLYPELFPGTLGASILGKGLEKGLWQLETTNIRDFAMDKHQQVDDIAFGGGPGMVMRADVIDGALQAVCKDEMPEKIIYLSPKGKQITQKCVKQLANAKKIVILCGRFEGIDHRILEEWPVEELSLGDFVLAGGEVAAMALVEACVRLLPGVVGDATSLDEESFSEPLLEYPHYTRPREWKGRTVPDVLLSGHRERIRQWRLQEAEKVTKERRPDLWNEYCRYKEKTS